MAEIQSYPTGTPTGTDQVPYVSDPGGTPALKLAAVSDLGGGGGGGGALSWTQVVNESGSSLTNWTTVSGTWSSTGGHIECTGAGMLRSDIAFDPALAVLEAEVQVPAGSGDRYAEILLCDTLTGARTQCQSVRIERVSGVWSWETERAAIVQIRLGTLTGGAEDTWFKLRAVLSGSRASLYVDGTFKVAFDIAHDVPVNCMALSVPTGAPAWYRNIKVWQADLGLPA